MRHNILLGFFGKEVLSSHLCNYPSSLFPSYSLLKVRRTMRPLSFSRGGECLSPWNHKKYIWEKIWCSPTFFHFRLCPRIQWYRLKDNKSADIQSSQSSQEHFKIFFCHQYYGRKRFKSVKVNLCLILNHSPSLAAKRKE